MDIVTAFDFENLRVGVFHGLLLVLLAGSVGWAIDIIFRTFRTISGG